ncbi:uncharacterized protein At4g15545 isoform X2 [Nymphaea colorata]|uniref:uncharacterized protein At4g15545 isoform X2 n=1 Tax=Nymphaea colorata TaxID=210225 RepID=UPI00129E40FD|nr:uncharacterized protein At4g15545 isoform X2 [Nymphaea colorata]
MSDNPTEFDLPERITAVLPADPYEQLDIARKITSIALATRVSKLEVEAARLRQKLVEKDDAIAELQETLQKLEDSLFEAEEKLSIATHEKENLLNENASLSNTVKKLNRDVAKLEVFKKTLMQSLQDEDDSSMGSSQVVSKKSSDISFSSQMVVGSESSRLMMQNQQSDMSNSSTEDASFHQTDATSRQGISSGLLLASHGSTPKLTPPDSPTRFSASVSPTRTSKPVSPPRRHSISFSRRGRVDGKEFFRQVRGRLSYEQFGAFLANVKELNAHKQTREETLRKADEIFGPDNKDLYAIFEGLISRSMHQNPV